MTGHHDDDATLVARARAGDDRAFGALVARHSPAVARTVFGLLGDGDEADDVGQEVFVRLHAALGQFREEASVRTYILRIAMNLSLNALRARRRRVARFPGGDTPEAAAVSDQAPAPDAAIERHELQQMVAQAIARLPEGQREVVVRRLLHERSTRETAEALGLPEGTVLSRLSRGLTQLRHDLGHLASTRLQPRRDTA